MFARKYYFMVSKSILKHVGEARDQHLESTMEMQRFALHPPLAADVSATPGAAPTRT